MQKMDKMYLNMAFAIITHFINNLFIT